MAMTPWSGNYCVDPTVWMHAHWTQFADPGWKIPGAGGGSSGYLDGARQNGTYVTVVSPDGEDLSVVMKRPHARAAVAVTLTLRNLAQARSKLPAL